MRRIIACLIAGSLLACAVGEEATPTDGEAASVQEPPDSVDAVLPDTVQPDTVMARDTAGSMVEY